MTINLTGLSVAELQALIPAIQDELQLRKQAQAAEALDKMRAIAAEAGLPWPEVLERAAPKTKRRPGVATKVLYRDPSDTSKTWSGRGRRPSWVIEFEKQHGNLDGLRVG